MRVAALLEYEGRVVVVRHRRGDATYHLLPGGGVAFGETLEDALQREVADETGLRCAVGRPLIVSDTIDPDGSRHIVNITFAARVVGGEITSTPDDPRVEAVELVLADELPRLDLRPPIASWLVEALLAPEDFGAAYVGSLFTPEV